jgi:hypothetical protein
MREYQNIAEFLEDHEDEVVVSALMTYYDLCNRPNNNIEFDQKIPRCYCHCVGRFYATKRLPKMAKFYKNKG